MLFKRATRTQAETIFMVAQNVSGSTITAGYSCVFDTSASVDGVRVTQASAGDLNAYAGVADADIANSGYGLIQVYGYRSSIYVRTSTSSSLAGAALVPLAASWALDTPAAAINTALKAFAFLAEAIAVSGAGSSQYLTTAKGFIRAL